MGLKAALEAQQVGKMQGEANGNICQSKTVGTEKLAAIGERQLNRAQT